MLISERVHIQFRCAHTRFGGPGLMLLSKVQNMEILTYSSYTFLHKCFAFPITHTHNSDASALDRRAARTGNTRNEKVYAQTPTGRHKSWLVGLLMPSPKFVLSKEFEYVLIDDAGKKMVENAAIDCHRWI